MPTPLTDADKVIRNDTGLAIVQAIQGISAPAASNVPYDNTTSGLTADNAQDAIDELKTNNDAKMNKVNPTGTGSVAIGSGVTASGAYSFATGYNTTASNDEAHAEGSGTVASGQYGSHAEGLRSEASGSSSHAEGYLTKAVGVYAHAEGNTTTANGAHSHTECYGNTANGINSHAEGSSNTIDILEGQTSNGCHVEGMGNTVSGTAAHAEGRSNTITNANYGHAEGYNNTIEGGGSHAEGNGNTASGQFSHCEGQGTKTTHRSQHVFGEYNLADTSTATFDSRGTYIEIVGKGSNNANRSNARTLDWSGNETLAGDLKINGTQSLSTLWTTLSGLTVLSGKSGSIASFSTDIADKLFSCYVNVTAQQAGSGTPAPDNVRAISGHSKAGISVTNDTITTKRCMERGTINSSGNNQVATTRLRTINNIPIEASTTYNFKIGGSSNLELYRLFEYDANGGVIYSASTGTSGSFTTASTTVAFRILIRYTDNSTITLDDLESIQITKQQAKGTVVTTIPFGDTYYGGVLDVTNGKLTVTHGIVLDLGALSWTYNSSGSGTFRSSDISSLVKPVATSDVPDFLCEMFLAKSGNDVYGGIDGIACSSSGTLWVHYGKETSVSNFVSAISGAKLVYELATHIEINLTPAQITTLLGSNNIYADCGDIDLKYLETIGNRL